LISSVFRRFQLPPRGQKRAQQCFLHVPRPDHPRRCAADRGIKEIKPDMRAVQQICADKFLCHLQDRIIQKDHMITIPPHGARHMQQDFIHR